MFGRATITLGTGPHFSPVRIQSLSVCDVGKAAEGHLKWKGENGSLGAVPLLGSRVQSPWWGSEADGTFSENMLFCHGFENHSDICIHCLQLFSAKWKKNKFGGRKVVGQATFLAQ